MSTYIHGIGASENIDSSGERIIIAGLDISSLDKDGVFNWEHKADQPSQIVGKVLKAKKIFDIKDCEDDYQKYFWNKCRVPYLYVMGELFDDYKDSAREVAGLFRYDADKKDQNERAVGNFSVEGAKIHKEGMDVTRSIARKITITALPCNKAAVAEMVAVDQPKTNKKSIDSLFKTESIEIEVLQVSEKTSVWDLLKKESLIKKAKELFGHSMKKDVGAGNLAYGSSTGLSGSAPTSPSLSCSEPDMARSEELEKAANLKLVPPAHPHGAKIGTTKSGKDVHSHAKVGQTGFSAEEHAEAAGFHLKAAAANPKMSQHHNDKARLHNSAAVSAKHKAAQKSKPAVHRTPETVSGTKPKTLHDPQISGKVNYKKSEVVAPGMQSDSTEANQKQQRARRAEEAYPNNAKHFRDEHKINHSSSNVSNVKRPMVPNKQIQPVKPPAGGPKNNMLHNNLLAPKETMHKAVGGVSISETVVDSSAPAPKPNATKLGQITKSLEAGSGLAAPNMLTGGAALGKESLVGKPTIKPPKVKNTPGSPHGQVIHKPGAPPKGNGKVIVKSEELAKDAANPANAPKDRKVKELQQKIDTGTYKPDASKIADAMLPKPKPMKKSAAYIRAEDDYAKWEKREEFETFMKSRMPHMTKSEIKAFGQAMLLNKSMRLEKSLDFANILEKNKK